MACESWPRSLNASDWRSHQSIYWTPPPPNKNGSCGTKSRSSHGMKVGVRMPYKSRSSYTIFSVKPPLFQGIFTPYDPSFYGKCFGSILVADMGSGGCRNCFQSQSVAVISLWACEGLSRHRPPRPHPRIRLAFPFSGVDLASIRWIDIDSTLIRHRSPDLTLFRCQMDPWGGEGEADLRVGSGGSVYKGRIPGFPRKSIGEGASSLLNYLELISWSITLAPTLLNCFWIRSRVSLLLQFTTIITLLQVPIAHTLLNCFGITSEICYTYIYTLDCFWIASVIISACRVGQPQGGTGASLGCARERDIFWVSPGLAWKDYLLLPLSIFGGKSGNSGLVPGNRDPKWSVKILQPYFCRRVPGLVALKRCDLWNASVCDLVTFACWRRCDLKRCDLGALKERGQCDLDNCVPKRSVSSCDLRFKTAI